MGSRGRLNPLVTAAPGALVPVALYLAFPRGVFQAKLVIGACLFVIMCGPVLLWPRRDNILAYRQVGIYASTVLVPLLGATSLGAFAPHLLDVYARLLIVGALAFVVGLLIGAQVGRAGRRSDRTSFGHPLDAGMAWQTVYRRARILGTGAAVTLFGSFVLLGYVPLLAADRLSAKYGVGLYADGFARGRLAYHFALGLASIIFPVLLIVAWRRRTFVDVALCGLVAVGLAASLSRGDFASGPLLVGAALAIERRTRPTLIVAGVCLLFLAGSLSNELIFEKSRSGGASLSTRLAAGADDVRDHLLFINGFEREGSQFTNGRTITAKLLPGSDPARDPSTYAIRLTTGLQDTSLLASGGIRLPAPLWGFVSFGFPGAAAFCVISGLFIGWGTVRVRRLLDQTRGRPGYAVNLVIATVYFDGIFVFMSNFFFTAFADVVGLVAAIMLGVLPWTALRRTGEDAVARPPGLVDAGRLS